MESQLHGGSSGGSNGSCLRCIAAAIVAALVFFGLAELVTLLGIEGVIPRQIALKGSMAVVAIGVWAALRQPWAAMGWSRFGWTRGCWGWLLLSCAAMAAATLVMILTGHRHPIAAQLSFGQIVLVIWLLSSVTEEIYVRGALQSFCQLGVEPQKLGPTSAPVVTSAVLFAAMHVPLMWKGGGAIGGGIIVAATLVVGWGCAIVRARTGSVWAPIVVHVLANMASVPGGIVGAIIYRVVHGEFPVMK